jgi:hypothetical protein
MAAGLPRHTPLKEHDSWGASVGGRWCQLVVRPPPSCSYQCLIPGVSYPCKPANRPLQPPPPHTHLGLPAVLIMVQRPERRRGALLKLPGLQDLVHMVLLVGVGVLDLGALGEAGVPLRVGGRAGGLDDLGARGHEAVAQVAGRLRFVCVCELWGECCVWVWVSTRVLCDGR